MGFSDFLKHSCDIYHIQKADVSPGFDLPPSPTFSYPGEPDLKSVPCHFHTGGTTITQTAPQAKYSASIKLALPAGTDIRINDKIVDCDSGYEYTAEIPRDIRGHHITVMVHRTAQQEAL